MTFLAPMWLRAFWIIIWVIASVFACTSKYFEPWERAFAGYIFAILFVPFMATFSVALSCYLLGWTNQ